jgi:dTDP-4-dehydrorhamnose reductase
MYKILVTGANGQLGNELKRISANYPAFIFCYTDIADLDITSENEVSAFLDKQPQNLILNCAAYTAVDKAETELELARKVNSEAVRILSQAALDRNMGFIHISTDFVFDGKKNTPYIETDITNPISAYGKTKQEGEMYALKAGIVIRTSWLYSPFGNNFMKTIIRLGKERSELGIVFDQIGSPTLAADLADAMLRITDKYAGQKSFPKNEIFHFSNEGVCSWYDFAREILNQTGSKCKIKPIETSEYPTPASRPAYSVLNKKKIREHFDLQIPHWNESLLKCMKEL